MSEQNEKPLVVIGSGSWGTALAIQFARSGRDTVIWGRDETQLKAMHQDRINKKYLPEADFPKKLQVGFDFAEIVNS